MTVRLRTLAGLVCTVTAFAATACSGGSAPDSARLRVQRDLPVAGVTTADVFAPSDGAEHGGLPVMVMLHGEAGRPEQMEPLARLVAATGAVVFVPAWPVATTRPASAEAAAAVYRDQVVAVVCSLREARVSAPTYGGDPGKLAVVGFSSGAMVGATVAFAPTAPGPVGSCRPDVDPTPSLFVGLAGDYPGSQQYAQSFAREFARAAPAQVDVTNRTVAVRLFHGIDDDVVPSEWTGALREQLAAIGVDAQAVVFDGDHDGVVDVTTPAGAWVATQLAALVRGQASVFDGLPAPSATWSFAAETCSYDGSSRFRAGDVVTLRLRNHDPEHLVAFSLVAVVEGEGPLALTPGRKRTVDELPPWAARASFRTVDAASDDLLAVAFLNPGRRFVPFCMPDSFSGHPDAGVMFAAGAAGLGVPVLEVDG